MDMTKAQLRERWSRLRMNEDAAVAASDALGVVLAARLAREEKLAAVMVFAAMPGEPDLSRAAMAWIAAGARVCVPRVRWNMRAMEPCLVRDWAGEITRDASGVPVPAARCAVVAVAEIDAVLVPGVAFDARGGRLGRGAGFYDRFLSRPECRAVKIGVGFETHVVSRVPMEGHDVAMDELATERGIVVCHGASGTGPT